MKTKPKICANCRFYRVTDRTNDDIPDECTHPKIRAGSEPDVTSTPEPDGVRYGGYDGYGDYLRVGPEFGCIHWQG